MSTLAILLFALAAIGGVYLAFNHLRGNVPPMAVGLIHGALAAVALVVLILFLLDSPSLGLGGIALALFVVAALGGFMMLGKRLRQQTLPKSLILVHGIAAVAAFVLMLIWILSNGA